MSLRGDVGGGCPGSSWTPKDTEHRESPAPTDYAERQRSAGIIAAASLIRARTGVTPRSADDRGTRDQRAEPMRQVDHFPAGYPGKEILVATGKADYLVRKDRPDDQCHVVLDHRTVDPTGRVAQHPAGELGDPIAGIVPTVDERRGVPPPWF